MFLNCYIEDNQWTSRMHLSHGPTHLSQIQPAIRTKIRLHDQQRSFIITIITTTTSTTQVHPHPSTGNIHNNPAQHILVTIVLQKGKP